MPKGYWIARVDVFDEKAYRQYVEASAEAYQKYGARCLARGGRHENVEGQGRKRNVVWEFPSFEAALACYQSDEYQLARAHRLAVAKGDFVIVEGLDD